MLQAALIALALALPASADAAPMSFGIYPGGAVGTANPDAHITVEEDTTRKREALARLAGDRRLAQHVYTDFTGSPGDIDSARQTVTEARRSGPVELVVRYRPASGAAVGDYRRFVARVTRELGPRLRWLQVGNEASLTGQPDAADGAYPRAVAAVARGVLAADRVRDRQQLRLGVGMNWTACDCDNARFFRQLRRHGGFRLVHALDWFGADLYPGTFSGLDRVRAARQPRLPAEELIGTLQWLRRDLLPLAGLHRVKLHLSENGFPTGPGRSGAAQARVLNAMVGAVLAHRKQLRITAYRWFDLRDSNSASELIEDGFGLMTDTYQPKPAFHVYRRLVARHGR